MNPQNWVIVPRSTWQPSKRMERVDSQTDPVWVVQRTN